MLTLDAMMLAVYPARAVLTVDLGSQTIDTARFNSWRAEGPDDPRSAGPRTPLCSFRLLQSIALILFGVTTLTAEAEPSLY
jgi:hypothetical protein